MKKFLRFLAAGAFIFFVASPVAVTTVPTTAAAAPHCDNSILGIPPWYRGLTNDDCSIVSPTQDGGDIGSFIWRIVLNVVQMALVIVAYLAIFFIIYGGFLFITGGSNPSQVEKAKKSIFNAVIGLIIAMGAIAITNFVFGVIGEVPTTANGIPTLTGEQIIQNGLNIVYFIAGVASVVVIIIAGILYALSAGDSGKVTRAKNMLTYSIVGLVIVLAAFAITNFVIGRFS